MNTADSGAAAMRKKTLLALATLLLASLCIMVLGTRWGLGVGPDSMSYLGYYAPDYGLPPLYTFVVASSRLIHVSSTTVAWAVNWLCYVGTVLVVSMSVFGSTRSFWLACLCGFLVLTLPPSIPLHTGAWSEPLFFLLFTLSVYLLCRYLESGRRSTLIGCALAVGLSAIARFPGIALIGLGSFSILLLAPGRIIERLRHAAVYLMIGILPVASYLGYVNAFQYTGGNIGGRNFGLHGNADLARYAEGADSLMALFLPSGVPLPVRAAFLVLFLAVLVFLCWYYFMSGELTLRAESPKPFFQTYPIAAIAAGVAYVAFLLVSVLVETNLPLYQRYAPPVYLSLLPGFAVLGYRYAMNGNDRRVARVSLLAFLLSLSLSNSARTFAIVRNSYAEGEGFSSRSWHQSPIIKHLKDVQYSQRIYSNGFDAIHYLTGISAIKIPQTSIRRTGAADPQYAQQVANIRAEIESKRAVIVWLDKITWRDVKMPRESQFINQLQPVDVLFSTADGRVYGKK